MQIKSVCRLEMSAVFQGIMMGRSSYRSEIRTRWLFIEIVDERAGVEVRF